MKSKTQTLEELLDGLPDRVNSCMYCGEGGEDGDVIVVKIRHFALWKMHEHCLVVAERMRIEYERYSRRWS